LLLNLSRNNRHFPKYLANLLFQYQAKHSPLPQALPLSHSLAHHLGFPSDLFSVFLRSILKCSNHW
jgi:hypothetical protein